FITSLPRYTSWDDVIVHFQKTGEFECIEIVKEKLKGVHGIGTKLLEFHKKSKNRIKKKYQTYVFDYYPMFTGLVLFALISEGKDEEAVQFMMDHYPDVSEGNTQCAYVLILLLKTILLADNYEYMNILYADLQKEKLLYQRSYKDIYDVLMQSCKLIEELYHKICLPKEDRFFEEHTRFIKETVFEEWGLIQDVRNIKNEYNHAQDQVKADMFLRIYNCINALSNTEGIHVALIGQTYGKNYRNCTFIKEKHHDDKVAMVIPWDGVDKAGRILTQLGDVDKGATSISNRSFFDRVDIVIKDILLEKLD
ncbi:MAG TPA: hypothetical protein DDZ89_08725, partial [Clostridiales bacterium]|nr:hypothetical protein [Clostridiales bacterium]